MNHAFMTNSLELITVNRSVNVGGFVNGEKVTKIELFIEKAESGVIIYRTTCETRDKKKIVSNFIYNGVFLAEFIE